MRSTHVPEHVGAPLPDLYSRLARISLHLKAKQPAWNKWARSQPVSATSLNSVCSAVLVSRSFLVATNDNIINHIKWQTKNTWGICGVTQLIKDFCTTCFSLWGYAAALLWEFFGRIETPAAKEFQQTLVVYFCSPLWCVLAKTNQLSPAWLCEAAQERPVTPDGGLIAANERVWSSGCWPRTTTSDRLKPRPLLKQHKASFQGPPSLLCFPLLAARSPHGVWV